MAKKDGHIKLRRGILAHLRDRWIDPDMFTAYAILLDQCDWATGIWRGSADKLASTGGWSKTTAWRILDRLNSGRYITSVFQRGRQGNYDIQINNFEPTIGPNEGKRLRRTKTRNWRESPVEETLSDFTSETYSRYKTR